MATRTIWQDVYTVEFDKTAHSQAAPFTYHMDTTTDPTYGVAEIGIQGLGSTKGQFSMPLNDHPNYKAPSGNLETEQATGIATRRKSEYNIVQTGEAVQFNLPQNGDAYNTSLFVQLLFQYGFTQLSPSNMAGMNVYQAAPYSSADTKFFAQFIRHLQPGSGSDAIDLVVKGGICHTLTVSGETGGLLTIEPTIYGAKWQQKDKSSLAATAADSFANIIPLKFQDSTFGILDIDYDNTQTITATFDNGAGTLVDTGSGGLITNGNGFYTSGGTVGGHVIVEGSTSNDGIYQITVTNANTITLAATNDGEATSFTDETSTASVKITGATWRTVNSPSISMTFTNNCQFNYYNDDAASNAIVGRLTVEGTFTMPFGTDGVGKNYMINKFLNGQEFVMAWYWGQSSDAHNIATDYRLQPDAAFSRYKNDSADTNTKNYLSFVVCARITDYEVSGDNELMIDVSFQGVKTDFCEAMKAYFAVDSALLDRIN